jgi:hypothetical protein
MAVDQSLTCRYLDLSRDTVDVSLNASHLSGDATSDPSTG